MAILKLLTLMSFLTFLQDGKTRVTMEHTTDTLAIVKENVAKGKAVLVDVRSLTEWKQGNIEGAIFLPVTSLDKNVDLKMLAKTLPKDKILYTFCAVGVRSKTAALKLQQHGYPVRALKPGYDDLIKAGFKAAKIEAPKEKAAAANESSPPQNAR